MPLLGYSTIHGLVEVILVLLIPTTLCLRDANGVKIKQAGIYKFTCTMMYSMYDINNGTAGRLGAPGDHGQSIRIATRFAKNYLTNDHADYVYGARNGMHVNNPGPVCVSPEMRWMSYETHRAASATWSCIINCSLNDVIKVYVTRAGYAIDNCVTPENACNLLVEYIG